MLGIYRIHILVIQNRVLHFVVLRFVCCRPCQSMLARYYLDRDACCIRTACAPSRQRSLDHTAIRIVVASLSLFVLHALARQRARRLRSPWGKVGFILVIAPHCTLPIRALSPTSPTQESRKGRASVVRIAQRVRATPRAQSHKPGVYEDRALFPPSPTRPAQSCKLPTLDVYPLCSKARSYPILDFLML